MDYAIDIFKQLYPDTPDPEGTKVLVSSVSLFVLDQVPVATAIVCTYKYLLVIPPSRW